MGITIRRQIHSFRPVMAVLNRGGNDGAMGTTLSHGLVRSLPEPVSIALFFRWLLCLVLFTVRGRLRGGGGTIGRLPSGRTVCASRG